MSIKAGQTEEWIAESLGMAYSTFKRKKEQFDQISAAIKKGRDEKTKEGPPGTNGQQAAQWTICFGNRFGNRFKKGEWLFSVRGKRKRSLKIL